MSDDNKEREQFTTPIARLSFPSLDKPSKMQGSQGQETFNATLLFTPASFSPADVDRWKKIRMAVLKQMKEKFGDKAFGPDKRLLPMYRSPIRNGVEKPNLPGYGQGVEFLRAASQYKPGLCNTRRLPIPVGEFYAGCYVRATISTWAYDSNGNKGVSFNLINVMKCGDGEAFGNAGTPVESDFGDLSADELEFDDPGDSVAQSDEDGDGEFTL